MCYSVLQCAAVCCSTLDRGLTKVHCTVLQCIAVCCSTSHCVAACCSVSQRVCIVLQCVAVFCSVLQCVAVRCIPERKIIISRGLLTLHCSVLQCVAVCCSVLQCVAVCCFVWECVAVCRSVSQCVAVCRSVSQCVAVRCSAMHTWAQDQRQQRTYQHRLLWAHSTRFPRIWSFRNSQKSARYTTSVQNDHGADFWEHLRNSILSTFNTFPKDLCFQQFSKVSPTLISCCKLSKVLIFFWAVSPFQKTNLQMRRWTAECQAARKLPQKSPDKSCHKHINQSCHVHEWVMSRIRVTKRSMDSRMSTFCISMIGRLLKIVRLFCKRALRKRLYSAKETYNSRMSTFCISGLPRYRPKCHLTRHVWHQNVDVLSHVWTSHAQILPRMSPNESCHTYECVMSHMWVRRVTSPIWMSHVTYVSCKKICWTAECRAARKLPQKSPMKETVFCKRDLWQQNVDILYFYD